jgi:hypothetical protein
MRRLTVLLNALATSCAGERRERCAFWWFEGDEKSHHTNPSAQWLATDLVTRGVRCSMPIAMKGLRPWRTTNDVVLGGRLDQLVVCRHHPDQVRPASRPGALHADNLDALTWLVGSALCR